MVRINEWAIDTLIGHFEKALARAKVPLNR